jgi:hypothetical protein
VGVSDFCAPSPTEVDPDDVYGEYLRSKGVDPGQDGDQHSEQILPRSDSAMERRISSNPAESDASTRRMHSRKSSSRYAQDNLKSTPAHLICFLRKCHPMSMAQPRT